MQIASHLARKSGTPAGAPERAGFRTSLTTLDTMGRIIRMAAMCGRNHCSLSPPCRVSNEDAKALGPRSRFAPTQ